MRFDEISPSGYVSKITDKDGRLVVDYTRYRTLELLSLEIHRKKIMGSIAELGVFRGDFSAIMNHLFPLSKQYLFDTFEGFSENDTKYELEKGFTTEEFVQCFKDTSVELVLSKMEHPENCIVKRGFFPIV